MQFNKDTFSVSFLLRKVILAIVILFLFWASVTASKGRNPAPLLLALWNWGHILLFALLTYYALSFITRIRSGSLCRQAVSIFLITLVLGVGIECWQYIFHSGKPDVEDVIRNFLGSGVVFLFMSSFKEKKTLTILLRVIILILLVREMLPVAYAAGDKIQAEKQFPVLADFESQSELSRWQGDAVRSLCREQVFHGQQALKTKFSSARYSSLSLEHFPGDWSAYERLYFHIFNPDSQRFKLTCRIHDRQHVNNGYAYSDRYHKEIILKPGWNALLINLREIEHAPESRKMDLRRIENFMLFSQSLPDERTIYIDYIYLK